MQADFNLSYAQLGLLPALYMAGLMLACIIFNELTNYVNSFRLVGEFSHFCCPVIPQHLSPERCFMHPWLLCQMHAAGGDLRPDPADAVQLLM